jgi:hypothetical protein
MFHEKGCFISLAPSNCLGKINEFSRLEVNSDKSLLPSVFIITKYDDCKSLLFPFGKYDKYTKQ